MKRRWALFLAAAFAISISAVTTAGASDHSLSGYAGTYSCAAGNDHYSMVITSEFGGRAIRVDSHGKYDSEYIVTYVPARGVYVAEYADARGGYEVMEGRPSGTAIRYHEVYPGKTDTMVESGPSAKMFSETYTTMSNGKPQSFSDTCRRLP
ncbi:MAG TPA: hypothetical protein VFO29_01425 [Candidatus Rubrimentiphilum sp.]|nr:hypothetical protein [Candidatus Rubrimentiphilum sp.]